MNTPPPRRRKVCDGCKRRKVRCDGTEGSGIPCSSCKGFDWECTFHGVYRRKETSKSYISSLETKVERMDTLLNKYASLKGYPSDIRSLEFSIKPDPIRIRPFLQSKVEPWKSDRYHKILDGEPMSDYESSDDEEAIPSGSNPSIVLPPRENLTPDALNSLQHLTHILENSDPLENFYRASTSSLSMPSREIALPLFESFFSHVTPFLPVLDRAAFETHYSQTNASRDPSFTTLVNLVCAVGAVYHPNDSRRSRPPDIRAPSGYGFFRNAKDVMRISTPTLADIQCRILAALYYRLLGHISASWMELGIGTRLAERVNKHRNSPRVSGLAPREEWIRSFWCLGHLDMQASCELGRPLAVRGDLDPPSLTVTDETSGCDIAFVRILMRTDVLLMTCLAKATHARSSGFWSNVPSDVSMSILRETQRGMDRILQNLPGHLRWDPTCSNATVFAQSAQIHCNSVSYKEDNLEICIQAALSTSQIAIASARRGAKMLPHVYSTIFTSGIVLLTAIWVKQGRDVNAEVGGLIEGVRLCIVSLGSNETWLVAAGRCVDVLLHLASSGGISIDSNDHEFLSHHSPEPLAPFSTRKSISSSPPPKSPQFFDRLSRSPLAHSPLLPVSPPMSSHAWGNLSAYGVPLLEDWFSQTHSNEVPDLWQEWGVGRLANLDTFESLMDYEAS